MHEARRFGVSAEVHPFKASKDVGRRNAGRGHAPRRPAATRARTRRRAGRWCLHRLHRLRDRAEAYRHRPRRRLAELRRALCVVGRVQRRGSPPSSAAAPVSSSAAAHATRSVRARRPQRTAGLRSLAGEAPASLRGSAELCACAAGASAAVAGTSEAGSCAAVWPGVVSPRSAATSGLTPSGTTYAPEGDRGAAPLDAPSASSVREVASSGWPSSTVSSWSSVTRFLRGGGDMRPRLALARAASNAPATRCRTATLTGQSRSVGCAGPSVLPSLATRSRVAPRARARRRLRDPSLCEPPPAFAGWPAF